MSHFNKNALLTVCTGARTGALRVEICSLSDEVAKATTFSYILNTFDCFSSPNFVFTIFHLFQSKIEPRETFLVLKWATSNVIAVLGQFWGEVITWCLVHVQKAVELWCEDQTKIHYGSRSNNYHQGELAILYGVGGGGGGLLNIDLTTKLDHFWNSIDGKRVLANKYRDIPPSKVKIFSLLINVAVVRRMALKERFCNGKTDTKWRKIVRKKFLVTFWPSQFDEPE